VDIFNTYSVGCTCSRFVPTGDYYKEITDVLQGADEITIDRKRVGFSKYRWNVELDELKMRCTHLHRCGLPLGDHMQVISTKLNVYVSHSTVEFCRPRQSDTQLEIYGELFDRFMQKDKASF
jgi:hypothetical protein